MTGPAPSALLHARVSGPVSQQIFTALLWAFAEPGIIRRLPAAVLRPEVPAACWPALALADVDVTVNVDDDPAHPLAALIASATGATAADLPDAWLPVLTCPTPAQLARVAEGDALHPERGARLTLAVEALSLVGSQPPAAPGGPLPGGGQIAADSVGGAAAGPAGANAAGSAGGGVVLGLRGPGIADRVDLHVVGLTAGVAARLGRASGPFPAGFDTWLVTLDGAVAGIPRSTTIEVRD